MDLHGAHITWLGHAGFRIETPGGKTVLIDPWLNNPTCPEASKKLSKVDLMLLTHGHFDHIADAVDIAAAHDPMVVGIFELCHWLQQKGVKQTSAMNKGGTQSVAGIKVTMTHALHSSGIIDGEQIIYAGEACGFVLELENGLKLYHAGDTCVFGDMRIIHDLYAPDVAMLPIGDHFTMSPREAAYALALLQPKAVIPMHLGTFPLLAGTVAELRKALGTASAIEILEMKPGQTIG